MQITFSETIATTGECFRRGLTYTLADDVAATFIASGIAVEVKPEKKAKPEKPEKDAK